LIVIRAKEVTSYWSKPPHHRELKVLLSPIIHETSKMLGIGMVTIPPGESGDVHMHRSEQETWYILSGKGKLDIGGESVKLEPEMIVVAPIGIKHQIINDSDGVLKALFIFTPAGPEEEFLV